MPYRDLEPAIRRIGRELQHEARAGRNRRERAEQALLDRLIARPAARARLFQLVDAFPALRGPDDVAAHIAGYLDHDAVPGVVRHAVRASRHVPGGERASATVARAGITRMASRFIAGTDVATARTAFARVWGSGMGVIVDLLGEKTITQLDADRYATRLAAVVSELRRDDATGAMGTPRGRASIAIKPSALSPRLDPLTAGDGLTEVIARLRPILRDAAAGDVPVWVDMEQHRTKDLTLTLFRSLLDDPATAMLPGIVIQAYLRDSHRDLDELIGWTSDRVPPIGVRLVKGAYWDTETVIARAHGWPVPVYEHKGDTDASYERSTRRLLEQVATGGRLRPAFASHNVRSLAHAIAVSDDLGLPRGSLEVQMLYGMEGGLARAVRSLGPQVDVYAPVGQLVPGMSYLVRRLLENSSNESFVRQSSHADADDELLAPPVTSEVAT